MQSHAATMRPRYDDRTQRYFRLGPKGLPSGDVTVSIRKWIVAVTIPTIGPKIRSDETSMISAGSNLRYGRMGNGGWIAAGTITPTKYARAPKVAAPARLIVTGVLVGDVISSSWGEVSSTHKRVSTQYRVMISSVTC